MSNATPDSGDAGREDRTSAAPFFRRLPQELRDRIYDFAYCDGTQPIKVMGKARFAYLQRLFKGIATHVLPDPSELPSSCFPSMAVSKQFYGEATQMWCRGNIVQISSPGDGFGPNTSPLFQLFACGSTLSKLVRFLKYCCDGGESRDDFSEGDVTELLDRCPRLSKFEWVIDSGEYGLYRGPQFRRTLRSTDFDEMSVVREILKSKNKHLTDIKLHGIICPWYREGRENEAALHEYIRTSRQRRVVELAVQESTQS